MTTGYRLASGTQVRKEDWGLLFYSQTHHKVSFIRSSDWLFPSYFDGTWNSEGMLADIAQRKEASAEAVAPSVAKLIGHLVERGMIVDAIR